MYQNTQNLKMSEITENGTSSIQENTNHVFTKNDKLMDKCMDENKNSSELEVLNLGHVVKNAENEQDLQQCGNSMRKNQGTNVDLHSFDEKESESNVSEGKSGSLSNCIKNDTNWISSSTENTSENQTNEMKNVTKSVGIEQITSDNNSPPEELGASKDDELTKCNKTNEKTTEIGNLNNATFNVENNQEHENCHDVQPEKRSFEYRSDTAKESILPSNDAGNVSDSLGSDRKKAEDSRPDGSQDSKRPSSVWYTDEAEQEPESGYSTKIVGGVIVRTPLSSSSSPENKKSSPKNTHVPMKKKLSLGSLFGKRKTSTSDLNIAELDGKDRAQEDSVKRGEIDGKSLITEKDEESPEQCGLQDTEGQSLGGDIVPLHQGVAESELDKQQALSANQDVVKDEDEVLRERIAKRQSLLTTPPRTERHMQMRYSYAGGSNSGEKEVEVIGTRETTNKSSTVKSNLPANCSCRELGDVDHEGWLTKRGGGQIFSSWKRKWVVLKERHLYYFKTSFDNEAGGVIFLDEKRTISPAPELKRKYAFKVDCADPKAQKLLLAADSQQEMDKWLYVLAAARRGDVIIRKTNTKQAEDNVKMRKKSSSVNKRCGSVLGLGGAFEYDGSIHKASPDLRRASLGSYPNDKQPSFDAVVANQKVSEHVAKATLPEESESEYVKISEAERKSIDTSKSVNEPTDCASNLKQDVKTVSLALNEKTGTGVTGEKSTVSSIDEMAVKTTIDETSSVPAMDEMTVSLATDEVTISPATDKMTLSPATDEKTTDEKVDVQPCHDVNGTHHNEIGVAPIDQVAHAFQECQLELTNKEISQSEGSNKPVDQPDSTSNIIGQSDEGTGKVSQLQDDINADQPDESMKKRISQSQDVLEAIMIENQSTGESQSTLEETKSQSEDTTQYVRNDEFSPSAGTEEVNQSEEIASNEIQLDQLEDSTCRSDQSNISTLTTRDATPRFSNSTWYVVLDAKNDVWVECQHKPMNNDDELLSLVKTIKDARITITGTPLPGNEQRCRAMTLVSEQNAEVLRLNELKRSLKVKERDLKAVEELLNGDINRKSLYDWISRYSHLSDELSDQTLEEEQNAKENDGGLKNELKDDIYKEQNSDEACSTNDGEVYKKEKPPSDVDMENINVEGHQNVGKEQNGDKAGPLNEEDIHNEEKDDADTDGLKDEGFHNEIKGLPETSTYDQIKKYPTNDCCDDSEENGEEQRLKDGVDKETLNDGGRHNDGKSEASDGKQTESTAQMDGITCIESNVDSVNLSDNGSKEVNKDELSFNETAALDEQDFDTQF